MKVLVTGGFGMVGHALQNVVKSANSSHAFVFLSRQDCDLLDSQGVQEVFGIHCPDVVIHLASRVGGVYANMSHNYEFLRDNLTLNLNVVEACRRSRVRLLVNVLSTCVFPDKGVTYPLTSDQLHNGLPHYSNIGYAFSKRILEVMSGLLGHDKDMKVVNLIPTNLYGQHDNYNLETAHVIPALIHKMYLAQEELVVKGDGTAVRQFLYAEDFARVILQFVDGKEHGSVTCVVSPPEDHAVSIKQVVDTLVCLFDYNGRIVYDTVESNGQLMKTTNEMELENVLGGQTFTSLRDGLKLVKEHFITHYNEVRN